MTIHSTASYMRTVNSEQGHPAQCSCATCCQTALGSELSIEALQVISELSQTDKEVRAHEAAHIAGGGASGGASFEYEKGPDGKLYAVAGEVPVNMQEGITPEQTKRNAQKVIASALAPANPSAQDYKVASTANMLLLKAEIEISKEMQQGTMHQESPQAANAYNANSSKTDKSTYFG